MRKNSQSRGRSISQKSQDRTNLSFRRPQSAKNHQAETEKNFAFSPFGTQKSKEKELKARLNRDRESKESKIRELKS